MMLIFFLSCSMDILFFLGGGGGGVYLYIWLRLHLALIVFFMCYKRIGSLVVECLTQDREDSGSSLTGVTALWSLSKTHLS